MKEPPPYKKLRKLVSVLKRQELQQPKIFHATMFHLLQHYVIFFLVST